MNTKYRYGLFAIATFTVIVLLACDDDDGGSTLATACTSADQCYPDIDPEQIIGNIVCLDRVEDGYCTHHCDEDEDCCAVEGECPSDRPVVCAPFESTSGKFCFLSCEGVQDENTYCETYAHPDFICRSTGGGNENRKVCVP